VQAVKQNAKETARQSTEPPLEEEEAKRIEAKKQGKGDPNVGRWKKKSLSLRLQTQYQQSNKKPRKQHANQPYHCWKKNKRSASKPTIPKSNQTAKEAAHWSIERQEEEVAQQKKADKASEVQIHVKEAARWSIKRLEEEVA
jgi:hypothetical protein